MSQLPSLTLGVWLCLFQFVCIAQQDYCCILNQVEKNMQKVEEEGEIVMVKEHRELDRTGTRKGHIVIKVTLSSSTFERISSSHLCCMGCYLNANYMQLFCSCV